MPNINNVINSIVETYLEVRTSDGTWDSWFGSKFSIENPKPDSTAAFKVQMAREICEKMPKSSIGKHTIHDWVNFVCHLDALERTMPAKFLASFRKDPMLERVMLGIRVYVVSEIMAHFEHDFTVLKDALNAEKTRHTSDIAGLMKATTRHLGHDDRLSKARTALAQCEVKYNALVRSENGKYLEELFDDILKRDKRNAETGLPVERNKDGSPKDNVLEEKNVTEYIQHAILGTRKTPMLDKLLSQPKPAAKATAAAAAPAVPAAPAPSVSTSKATTFANSSPATEFNNMEVNEKPRGYVTRSKNI